jgi:aspartate/methionine/tyrosine aminotransferase
VPSGSLLHFKNLTSYEIETLSQSYNLTDGHAFRRWTRSEEAIIDRSAELFRNNNRRMQPQIESEYIKDFLWLGKQLWDQSALGYMMCYTASMAFEVVANYLRTRGLTVTLVEPAFDNLADIFRRHQIPLRPLEDRAMEAPPGVFARILELIDTDVICLVSPNNPTGASLTKDNMRILARFCKDTGKLLVLDACFRAYVPRDRVYDQYKILIEEDTDFVVIEDTGKTWPTVEIKAPFFAVSRSRGLFSNLYNIYTDFLLHVSPVGIKLMHEFIRLSISDDLKSIRNVVEVNRRVLHKNIEDTFLQPCGQSFLSVAWLRIDSPLTGMELRQILDGHGVFVLPGEHFYWANRSQGEKYIRVALTRDEDMFSEAANVLGCVCRKVALAAHA